MDIDYAIIYFSALSFLFYGISSFYSRRLISEYERWGYNKLRIMMLVAVFARIKIKDSIANTMPAILYVIINSIIFYHSIF